MIIPDNTPDTIGKAMSATALFRLAGYLLVPLKDAPFEEFVGLNIFIQNDGDYVL